MKTLTLAAALLLAGCSVPVPSSIGLAFTDEVEMSLDDLAGASLFTGLCDDAGHAADHQTLAAAVQRLNAKQRRKFNDWQSDANNRRAVQNGVTIKACAEHAAELKKISAKRIVVVG